MIQYKMISRDFDELGAIVQGYLSFKCKDELQRTISDEIKIIVVEYPYVDKDFRDTYYNDFAKRHEAISRDSVRVHFFREEQALKPEGYMGFITLRDTAPNNFGRSYLSPKVFKNYPKGYYCLATYTVELMGKEFSVDAFPWMQQDVDVSTCSHVATWGVIRYFSEKYSSYAEKTLYQITKSHNNSSRKIPSSGLTVEQISQTFSDSGFYPEIYFREPRKINSDNNDDTTSSSKIDDSLFDRLLYIFIESGIPCVAGLSETKHAVSIIGHCLRNDIGILEDENKKRIIDASELIESLIIIDDNQMPYHCIGRDKKGLYKISSLDSVIVPFHEKMYVDAKYICEFMLPKLERTLKIDKDVSILRRVLLTSSRSYKVFINKNYNDSFYKEDQLRMCLPRFIWIIEYAPLKLYIDNKITHRVIIDATLLRTKKNFLRIKDRNKLIDPNITFPDEDTIQYIKLNTEIEPMYVNNLQEIL